MFTNFIVNNFNYFQSVEMITMITEFSVRIIYFQVTKVLKIKTNYDLFSLRAMKTIYIYSKYKICVTILSCQTNWMLHVITCNFYSIFLI